MFRGLLTPRWLGLLAAAVVAAFGCAVLGLWQLGVARDEGRKETVAAAESRPRAPLSQVTRPHADFAAELSNRPVTAQGRYLPERSVVVVDRRLGDRSGSWVVTPLVTAEGTIAVLRGFVDGTPTAAPAPPAGEVAVQGTLGPSESPRAGDPLPAPQRRSLDLAVLVNEWPGELYNAVLVASAEQPAPDAAPARVPPPQLESGLGLRNAAYAVQWWVFGLFALWMWWKMFRAEQGPGQVAAPGPYPARAAETTAGRPAEKGAEGAATKEKEPA